MIPMPYVWLGVILLAIIVELSTMGLVSIWFLPGALTALVLALLDVDLIWQIAAFVVLSVLTLTVGRRLFRPFNKKTKTNADALIGQRALITEQVSNIEGRGALKIGGQVWSARAEQEGEILEVGDEVEIVDIRGVKLICRKK